MIAIDDPADFIDSNDESPRIFDGGVVYVDGVQGMHSGTEPKCYLESLSAVPHVTYIAKMDQADADFELNCREIEKVSDGKSCPIQIPIGTGADFIGLVDLIDMKAIIRNDDPKGPQWRWSAIPVELKASAVAGRDELVRRIRAHDDSLASPDPNSHIASSELRAALRREVIRAEIFPILCGSSEMAVGHQPLLDAVHTLLPAPSDRPPARALDALSSQNQVVRAPNDDAPFAALIFKVESDPVLGPISFVRVFSGKMRVGESVMFGNDRSTSRLNRLFCMRRDGREELAGIFAGEIAAVLGIAGGRLGQTMCDPLSPVIFKSPTVK